MRSAPEGRERSAMVIRQAYIDSADAATTVGCCIAPHYGHRFSNTPYRRINMSCIQSAHNQAATSEKASGVPRSLVLLMATTAGVGVASPYYNQPQLGVLGPHPGAGERALGLLAPLAPPGH